MTIGVTVSNTPRFFTASVVPLRMFQSTFTLAIISSGGMSEDTVKEKFTVGIFAFPWPLFGLSKIHGLPDSLRYAPSSVIKVGI